MAGWLKRLTGGIKARREACAREVLAGLKVRYHTFRVLLANNERALAQLCALEAALGRGSGLDAAGLEDFLETTFELVDGLNRLSGEAHPGLYDLQNRLAATVRELARRIEPESAVPDAPLAATPFCLLLSALPADEEAALALAGGKAANLARLLRAGLPVPPGFVVTTAACRRFLTAAGLDLPVRRTLREVGEGRTSPEEAGEKLARLVTAAPLPDDLAAALDAAWQELSAGGSLALSARSSARVEDRPGMSFAGQFRTILNVTSAAALREAYRQVVAGSFGPRPIGYRLAAGLPLADFGLAVLCQRMVPARAAGVLYSLDPTGRSGGRMLVSAAPGLGTQVVDGSAPVDVYHPRRDGAPEDEIPQSLAVKEFREVPAPGGGLVREAVPEAERLAPLLSAADLARLSAVGRLIESLCGAPQDIEWAIDARGALYILQARAVPLPAGRRPVEGLPGRVIISGGIGVSPGRAVGRVALARSREELAALAGNDSGLPTILILHQSLADAAPHLPALAGVAVDLGNPADHLSCVAREKGVPMLTGLGSATRVLAPGQWVVIDAGRGELSEAPGRVLAGLAGILSPRVAARKAPPPAPERPEIARLRALILPLNLTDAYGPSFSAREVASLHDIVRYCHEMAVMTMFEAADTVVEEASGLVRYLADDLPLHFLLIDLGGGLAAGGTSTRLSLSSVLSRPLTALCAGMNTPGLRWRSPPGESVSGLFSRGLTDARSARPAGAFNYALITRDYLNLNARVDYHFTMIDSVCGLSPRENYIRIRFKGGGTSQVQRERRARCLAMILQAHDFFTDLRGDLLTAQIHEIAAETAVEGLILCGRLLGFTRLLDAAMTDEDRPGLIAKAFLDGDYALSVLDAQAAGKSVQA